jgi:hypothetical protein
MSKRRRQTWHPGDVFFVTLTDGTHVVAQIVGQEQKVLNCVSCAFYDLRISNELELATLVSLPAERMFSILFVTRGQLDHATWCEKALN